MRNTTTPSPAFNPAAGILALLFPGAGHWLLGERRRARLIASGVLGLFLTGILVGGIDVVDSKGEDRIWYMGQSLVGPLAWSVNFAHQHHFKGVDPETGERRSAYPDETRGHGGVLRPAQPGERPPNIKSMAKVNELGTLFCTVAGMMNLIVIVDAAFPRRREPDPRDPPENGDGTAVPGEAALVVAGAVVGGGAAS